MTDTSPPEAKPARPALRWGRLAVWAVVLGLLIVLGLGVVRAQRAQVRQGEPAPDFTITGFANTPMAGQTFTLSEARGQVVVVNFWASWCLPCRDEAADLEAVWQQYRDRGVMVVGIDWVDTEREALAFINEFGQTYLNGPDLGTRAGQAYGIRAVPETYVVDRNGRLAWVKIGPTTLAELQGVIEGLLGS